MFQWFRDIVDRKNDMDDPSIKKCCNCGKPVRKGDKRTKKDGMLFHRHCWKLFRKKTYQQ